MGFAVLHCVTITQELVKLVVEMVMVHVGGGGRSLR